MLVSTLGDLKANGIDTSLPSVLMRADVGEKLQEALKANGVKWTVKQCRDKFKNVLKDYRKQMRLCKIHTGGGEAPVVPFEVEMARIVSSTEPAIQPPLMLDGKMTFQSTDLISSNSSDSLKRPRQTTGKQDMQSEMMLYFKAKRKATEATGKADTKLRNKN